MTEEIKPSFAVNFPSDFRKAIAEAEKYLSDKPTLPKWGNKWTANIKNAGYVIGMTSETGCCWWHVDFDGTKKLHINAIDSHTGVNSAMPLLVPGGLVQSDEYLQSFLEGWWFEMTVRYQNSKLPETVLNNLKAASLGAGASAAIARNRLAFFRYPD
jgi:hypothetical protein